MVPSPSPGPLGKCRNDSASDPPSDSWPLLTPGNRGRGLKLSRVGAPAGDKGLVGRVPAERRRLEKGGSVLGGPLLQAQWVDVRAPAGLYPSLSSDSVRSPGGTGPGVQGWGDEGHHPLFWQEPLSLPPAPRSVLGPDNTAAHRAPGTGHRARESRFTDQARTSRPPPTLTLTCLCHPPPEAQEWSLHVLWV